MLSQSTPANSRSLREEPYGVVYFIGHGASGPVKIGFTADRDVSPRLRQLQTGTPEVLSILGVIPAYFSAERAIQAFLQPHSVRGEWFERESALVLLARLNRISTHHDSTFVRELRFLYVRNSCAPADDEAGDTLAARVARDLLADIAEELAKVNTEYPLPFRAWLSAQKGRDHPTGDLASDMAQDKGFPVTGSLKDYLTYITARSSDSALTRTVIDAWIECDVAVANLRMCARAAD